ncbi:hypothetical protein BGZ76_000907, partial [Entomortierella beljakovae]
MLGWSKSNNSGKPDKVKTPKPPKAQVVITMPGRKQEFGMGTFGTETEDTASVTGETATECPILTLPKISDQVYEGDTNFQDQCSLENTLIESTDSVKQQQQQQQQQQLQKTFSNPVLLSFHALQQHNSGFMRRDQSLGTPLRTPNTPSSTGLTTPHSIQTSYFPATPASANTVATSTTSISFRTSSTATFGNCHDRSHIEEFSSNVLNNSEKQQPPTTTTTTTPCAPAVPETKKQRNNKPEMPPAIVTNPSLAAQRSHLQSTSQTPSTPHTPALFTNRGYQHSSTMSGSYSTPAGATAVPTPKTPGSVSEWRMMQMQLQQQDDFHFSLSLPSVSALSFNPPSTRMAGSSPAGHPHVSGSSATSAPVSFSGCSCCHNNNSRTSPSGVNVAASGVSITETCIMQSPVSAAPTFGNMTPGLDSATQHHSFLLPLNPPGGTLGIQSTVAYSGSNYTKSNLKHNHPLYNHCNASTSSDYESSRDMQTEGMPPGHELGVSQGLLLGSGTTLHSDYAPSSIDPLEYDHAANNNCPSYGPSSAGSEAPLNQIGNYPYLRSAPASAVGGSKTKHRKNCPQKSNGGRPSLGAGAITSSSQTPISPVSGLALSGIGGTDIEVSTSSTSLAGSNHSSSMRRDSSPSLGSFKSLSSKLAVNTMRKLSISQKSIFGNSRDDLLGSGTEYQCIHENVSHESVSENGAGPSRTGGSGSSCCQCHSLKGNTAGSSVCSDGDPNVAGSNKAQRSQSKLNSLRGVTGSKRGRKEKSRRSPRRSYEMEYNFSSQFVRQEFAQYNYERQIEDFQRAARVFKEQRALTDAAAGAAFAAEARAAVAAAAAAAAAIAKQDEEDLLDFPSPSQVPEAEMEGFTQKNEIRHNTDSLETNSIKMKSRKKSIAASTRSGLLGSISRSQRRVGACTVSSGSSTKAAAEGLTSPKKSNTSLYGGSYGSRASSLNHNSKTDIAYLELDQVGLDVGSEWRLSLLGLGNSMESNAENSGNYIAEGSSAKSKGIRISRTISCLDVRTMVIQDNQDAGGGGFDEIPLNEIIPSPLSIPMNSACETLGAENRGGNAVESTVVLENSPIQVIRATVGTVDDPSLPCFTFRMWILSTVFVVMGAAISEYNFFRSNSAYFSIYFVQLASYFCGKAMARCLPTREFEIRFPCIGWVADRWSRSSRRMSSFSRGSIDENEIGVNSDHSSSSANMRRVGNHSSAGPIRGTNRSGLSRSNLASTSGRSANGRRRFSWRFTLNPGKFNMKEHMLIGVAAAAGCSPAYATNVIAIQSLVFSSPLGNMTGIGLVVSSQFIGFSMAWFLFDYVIKPSVMIWPATLVNVSLYNTLHEHKVLTKWFTRMQLFWYAFFAIFIYQWLPRMFMPVLTSMALLCWINPSSNVLRKLGSGYTGLGMGCISLDWSIISGVGPLYTPWWAQCNFFLGLIGMLWIITPIAYFSNYWSAMSYPIVSSNLYDNATQLYDISKIVNKDLSFNITMYESYSPVIMTPYFAITYGTSFMAVIATFVHVALFYGSDIWLIAKTRCSRKLVRAKNSSIFQSASTLFQNSSNSNIQNEDVTVMPATTSATKSAERQSDEYENGFMSLGRRKSESRSLKKDTMDSSLGMGGIGLGSEDLDNFHQSSHYRELPLPHDCFGIPQAPRPSAKPTVDERDQIPTEMFGVEDIHTSLMRAYPEIPGWWFGLMFVVCFVMAVFVCNTSDIRLPVYSLILALLLAAVFALPMAIIQALSSSQIGLNVLSEVVCGYLLPGNQLGNSVFKCYSYMALYQCLNLTQGFKLGHYMKVPPRNIFIAVIYGTLIGAFVNLQVLDWVLLYNRQALFDSDSRRHYPPYGAMCKGDSPFPFLPNCKCPASHIAASGEGDGTTVVYPKRRGSEFDNAEGSENLGDTLERGRSGRAFSSCWPFGKTERGKSSGDDKTTDAMTGPSTLSPSQEDAELKNQGNAAPTSRNHPEFIPHIYYGNPDGAWDHLLRRFPWHLINTPLICVGASFVPQAPASFVVSAGIVAFCFAFLVLRYRHEWWRRYTFVLAAALDA